ncbi:MAG: riboflavin synthase [Candidatus Omnitrophota bacterium]
MFTGIIQEIGKVAYFSRYQKSQNLRVRSKIIVPRAKIGDSISVNGVCLTVTKIKADILNFDLLPETINLTNLGLLKFGDSVNLEESLTKTDKISGHFVTGHIDCLGTIKKKGMIKNNCSFEITIPKKFMNLLVPKGSVSIEGISLTIVDVYRDSFTVYIIPHTFNNTILGQKVISNKVNIEFDILAKYSQNPKKTISL